MPAPFSGENRGPEIHTVFFVPATFSDEKDRVRNIKKLPVVGEFRACQRLHVTHSPWTGIVVCVVVLQH